MNFNFDSVLEVSIWAVPLIVAICQAIKMTNVPTKYMPLISILVGVGLAWIIFEGLSWGEYILNGLILGLSSSGLYSGIRTTQMVADVRAGTIPLEKIDQNKLDDKDRQIIAQRQNQNPQK